MLKQPFIAKTAFTKFEEGVHRLMQRNEIHTSPLIHISSEPLMGNSPAAAIRTDAVGEIHVAEKVAKLGNQPFSMCLVAHETGHILAAHKVGMSMFGVLVDSGKPPVEHIVSEKMSPSGKLESVKNILRYLYQQYKEQDALAARYKLQEHEADQIMAHLVGDKTQALQARKILVPGSEWTSHVRGTSALGAIFSPVSEALQRANFKKLHGTAKELAANIDKVDLNDRSHVDRLIARRNNATMHLRS